MTCLMNPLRFKHSWVLMGLRVIEDGTLPFGCYVEWDYEQCRHCGKRKIKQ